MFFYVCSCQRVYISLEKDFFAQEKTRKMKRIAITVLVFGLFSGFGFAQTTVSHTVKIIAHPILDLKLENASVSPEFNFRTIADYENGVEKTQAASLKIKANRPWVLNVKAGTESFQASGNQTSSISSSALIIKKSGGSENIALTTYDQAISNGTAGGIDKNKVMLDYKADPGFISPDSYVIELTYTLTAP